MGIVLLSLGDLVVTVAFLRSTGMIEANPIAGFLIRQTGSISVLTAYKAMTVLLCIGLLYRLRRYVEGEVAAWCAVLILAVTSFQWHHYARHLGDLTDVKIAQHGGFGDEWLHLD